jgi:hypothetical protein
VHAGQADLEGLDPRLKPLLAAALSPNRKDRPTQEEIMTGLTRYSEGRDALVPREAPTVAEVAPTKLVTKVMPTEESPTPTEVAQLVPSVIPPLSAFTPIRDKIREAAAKKSVAAAPVHPALYSPAPSAAAPAAMPLPYQAGPPAAAPYQGPYRGPYQDPAQGPYQGRTQGADQGRPPAPYQQPGQPAQPAHPDKAPPTGRRTAVIVGFMIALTGLTALNPGAGTGIAILLLVLARTVDRSSTALMRRRQVRGRSGKSDGLVAAASSPLQLVTAGLVTLPCLILPLIMGVVIGGIITGVAATAYGLEWQPLSAVGFGSATLTALFTAWWGPGGSSLRRGAHITARNTVRAHWLSALVAVVLLAIGGITFYQATQGAGADWARNPIETPQLDRPSFGDLRDAPFIRDLPIIGR